MQLSEARWDGIAVNSVIAGAAARITWILVIHPPVDVVYSDMRGYVSRAERLASGGDLGPLDAFFPPGTHVVLAIPMKVFGTGNAGLWAGAVLWCALSIVTVWLAWRLARELLTPAAAAVTAVLSAASPLFIGFGGFFTSETPSMAFLLASLWLGVRSVRRGGRRANVGIALAGALGGVAIAIRPQLGVNLAILVVAIVVATRERTQKVRAVVAFGVGALVVLAPAVALNSAAAGELTGLSTNGGMNFWFGHCNVRGVRTLDDQGRLTGWWTHAVPNLAGRGDIVVLEGVETWDEDVFYERGWNCIEDDGVAHVGRLARNVLDMTATTTPWPLADDTGWKAEVPRVFNLAYSLLLPLVLVASLFRLRRGGRCRGEAFLLANLLCIVPLAILVVGDPRVRSVYDVFGFALIGVLLAPRLER